MTHDPEAVIRRGRRDEAEEIAAAVRDGFATVAAEIHLDIPPLHESADDIRAAFDAGEVVLVAEIDGSVVGTIRGERDDEGAVMVRRLAVRPEFRRQGIARRLLGELERAYPATSRFLLFTGRDALGPLSLYESMGYRLMEPAQGSPEFLVYLEKCVD